MNNNRTCIDERKRTDAIEKRRSVTLDWESLSALDPLSSVTTQMNMPTSKKQQGTQNYYNEFLSQLIFLQSIFIRLSWVEKNFILRSLLRSVINNDILNVIPSVIGSIFTKDVLYVLSQNVQAHVFDKVPLDDNRSLPEPSTVESLCQKILWFMAIEGDNQEKVLLALLKCAGGACIRKIYVESLRISVEPVFYWSNAGHQARETTIKIPSVLPGYSPSFYKKPFYRTAKQTSGTSTSMTTKPLNFNLINDLSMTVVAGSKIGSFFNSEFSIGSNNVNLDDWKFELTTLRQKIISSTNNTDATEVANSDTETNKECDKLQMLPSWIVEKIVSYLDLNSRNELSKVSNYWAYIVDEVKKEEDERMYMNKVILVLKSQFTNIADLPDIKSKEKNKKKPIEKEKPKTTKMLPMKLNLEPAEETIKHGIIESQITTNERKGILNNFRKNPLSGKYVVTALTDQYRHNRLTDCTSDGKFLITTAKSHTMAIHSLITGCQLATKLIGHTGPITCLKLHPDGSHVITGSVDATVRYWDFKHRIQEHIYIGHTKTITAISVNSKYIISASYDKIIRVHDISSTIVHWSFEDQSGITTALFLTEDERIYTGCATGKIKKYNLAKKKFVTEFETVHTDEVKLLLISQYLSHFVISAGVDGFIHCFNVFELKAKPAVTCSHGSPVTAVSVMPSGYLMSGCEDGRLRIWNSTVGLLLRVIRPSADLRPIRNLHFCNINGITKLVINLDTCIYLFEFDNLLRLTKKKQPISNSKEKEVKKETGNTTIFPLIHSARKFSVSSFQAVPRKETIGKPRKRLPSTRSLYYCCAGSNIDPEKDDGKELRINDVERLSRKEERLIALGKRCCTLPKIRNKNLHPVKDVSNTVLLSALQKNPRTVGQIVSQRTSVSSVSTDQVSI